MAVGGCRNARPDSSQVSVGAPRPREQFPRLASSLGGDSPTTTVASVTDARGRSLTVRVRVLALVPIAFGAALWALACTSQEAFRGIVERLSPDGSIESLGELWARLPWVGSFILLCGGLLLGFSEPIADWIRVLPAGLRGPGRLSVLARVHARIPRKHRAALLLLCALGLGLRLHFLWQPVRYDEAYTYIRFASKPLYIALADYGEPNNHLLNTLCVFASTRLFGNNLVALRLPALVAGMALIPLTYAAAAGSYGPAAALLAAALVASSSYFIEFSTNARGYSLFAVFFLLLVMAARHLVERRSEPIAWTTFVVAAVLGIYALPSMVYPLGGVALWMWLSSWKIAGVRGSVNLLRRLTIAGLVVSLLSILMYVPSILFSGTEAIVANRWVQPLPWSRFAQIAPGEMATVWRRWQEGVPAAARWLCAAGAAFALAFHRRISRDPVPLVVPLLMCCILLSLALRVVAYPRTWIFVLLIYLMMAGAGLSRLVPAVPGLSSGQREHCQLLLAIALAVWLGRRVVGTGSVYWSEETGSVQDADAIVEQLQQILRPGDRLLADAPASAVLAYKFRCCFPQLERFLSAGGTPRRIVGLVRTYDVLEGEGSPDGMRRRMAKDQVDVSAFSAPRMLAEFRSLRLYEASKLEATPSE
jgi:Dolichyl-phosphate-mannose-protein mannosyltransferase